MLIVSIKVASNATVGLLTSNISPRLYPFVFSFIVLLQVYCVHYYYYMSGRFETVAWAKRTNIYEVNVRQYTKEGTFAAFQKALPRLKEMGVETLWFMPITPISEERRQGTLGSYYACKDYTSTNPEFGSVDNFKSLVEEAHALDLKVIIDWVGNHTGWDHVWSREHPEYYKKDENGNFYDSNGWVDVIDLNYENEDLRAAIIEAMHFWIRECDIDGFRCDMAHLVPLDFWREARTALDKEKKLFWLAETEEPAYHEVFDASYAWQFLHSMEALYRNETNINSLKSVLEKYKTVFPQTALRAYFTTNHDENSHSGSEYERMGNAAKAFAVLCATLPNSVPLVYSGQELPNLKRLLFFDKDEIEWNGKYELHNFYKTLLSLRKSNAAFESSEMKRLTTTANDNVFVFVLEKYGSAVVVLLNLSYASRLRFEVLDEVLSGKYKNAFSKIEFNLTDRKFDMEAWEYRVYVKGS